MKYVTILLFLLPFSLLSQRFNLNLGPIGLNEDTVSTFGYKIEVGGRYVGSKDADGFGLMAGYSVGFAKWSNDEGKASNLVVKGYFGFSPIWDMNLLLGLQYFMKDQGIGPVFVTEFTPLDKFLTEKLNMVFSVEGGIIKYLDKASVPTGYLGFNLGFVYTL